MIAGPPEEVRRYRMASVEDVEKMIASHRTRLVVAGVWENNLPPIAEFEGTARRSATSCSRMSAG